jgi:CRP-like cAMP-binding protein
MRDDGRQQSKVKPNVTALLEGIDEGKTMLRLQKDATVFSQGDKAEAIYFIRTGRVKITVVSSTGREAVLSIVKPREFFGEGCLGGQTLRFSTATTMQSSTLFRIEKRAMFQALHSQPRLAANFTTSLLFRSIGLKADLCEQIFNHTEKRLARILLRLSRMGRHDTQRDFKIPRMTHEALAEIVGTTTSCVTELMAKFRALGVIGWNGEDTVKPELLTDLLLRD